MEKKKTLTLKERFEQVAEDYAREFCRRYELEEYSRGMWVLEEVGGTLEASDYDVNMDEIRYCIDNDVKWEDFVAWYDYTIRVGMIDADLTRPNLPSWMKGCPRMSEKELKELEDAQRRVREAKEALRKVVWAQKNGDMF